MKNVLVVDATPVFSEFLKDKFNSENIEVSFVQDKLDSIPKMISLFPDLVIVEITEEDPADLILEFLKKVKSDPNASQIPLIAAGPQVEKNMIAVYAKLGVSKYFIKPIKFDVFFESIGHYLKQAFSMDPTPCVLELHRNENIIFIEVAQGLNREKLFLLRYKLSEMIEKSGIDSPKIIIMMTNLDLTFVDGLNMELLLSNVLSHYKVRPGNVYVLSLSPFVRELINGHQEYNGVQVATDINQVLNSIIETKSSSKISDIISDKILTSEETVNDSSLEMRFSADSTLIQEELAENSDSDIKVAIVDDDSVILDLLSAGFKNAKLQCDTYLDAKSFLQKIDSTKYSLIILDILMPGISGFEILKQLKSKPNVPPIFVYSQALKREMVIQALQLGARQYLVKPQKPEIIVKKAMDVINAAGNK